MMPGTSILLAFFGPFDLRLGFIFRDLIRHLALFRRRVAVPDNHPEAIAGEPALCAT
jgi:hypothetical protein